MGKIKRPRHICTVAEARAIGETKLGIRPAQFEAALRVAEAMPDRKSDDVVPISALALAVVRTANCDPRDPMFYAEFTDALRLVIMAEQEWRLDQKAGSAGRQQ
jgi:hypothetical protein